MYVNDSFGCAAFFVYQLQLKRKNAILTMNLNDFAKLLLLLLLLLVK